MRHCEREKTADVIPAHFATCFLSIPKLSIISGWVLSVSYVKKKIARLTRYGKTEVMATGSANLHIACIHQPDSKYDQLSQNARLGLGIKFVRLQNSAGKP